MQFRTREALLNEVEAATGRHDDPVDAVAAARAVRRRELFRIAAGRPVLGVRPVEAVAEPAVRRHRGRRLRGLSALPSGRWRPSGGTAADAIAVIAMGPLGGHEQQLRQRRGRHVRLRPAPGAVEQEAPRPRMRSRRSCAGCCAAGTRTRPSRSTLTCGRRAARVRWCAPWRPTRPTTRGGRRSGRPRRCSGPSRSPATPTRPRFRWLIDPMRWPDRGSTTPRSARSGGSRPGWRPSGCRGGRPTTHVKLGRGGLADIEWTVQLLQLRHAAAVPELRTTRTLAALGVAASTGLLADEDATVLADAWRLAARIRNAVMLVRGRPGDSIPTDPRERAGVARLLGYPAAKAGWLSRTIGESPAELVAWWRGCSTDDAGSTPRAVRCDVAVDGMRFSVWRSEPNGRASGSSAATPVLLLHGVPQTAAMWQHLAAELSSDRVVLAPDLPGLGRSELRGPYDVRTVAARIAALGLHEASRPIDVAGHDWGGAVALVLARSHPDLVRRIVILNTAASIC